MVYCFKSNPTATGNGDVIGYRWVAARTTPCRHGAMHC